jgi:hypothetical protein
LTIDRDIETMSEATTPQLDDEVRGMLATASTGGDTTVELLVGLRREDADASRTRLRESVQKIGGEITQSVGFDIYRVSIPQSSLDNFVQNPTLEYVESPDEDGGPEPMGN